MVEKPTKQTMRFSDRELSKIKMTFAERDELLITLRKMFLQLLYTEQEEVQLREAITPDMFPILDKRFNPKLLGDMPLGQEFDFLTSLNIDGQLPEIAVLLIKAQEIVVDYLGQCIDLLAQGEPISMSLDDMADRNLKGDDKYIKFTARKMIIGTIEGSLIGLMVLAGTKQETEEQQNKRLTKDSSQ